MQEVQVISSTSLIEAAFDRSIPSEVQKINDFTSQVKNMLIDGVDYGVIPKTEKPCLFKSGGEKIQFLLGLTPQYTVIDKHYTPEQRIKTEDGKEKLIDSYYRYEFMCSLYHNNVKVAEGVGTANTKEKKYVAQQKFGIYADDLANTVMKIAKKRAFMDAIIAVACISDMFTQDLEDSETVKSMKVDKKTKATHIDTEQIKAICAEAWAGEILQDELVSLIQEVNANYKSVVDIKRTDYQAVFDKVHQRRVEKKKGEKGADKE